MRSLFPMDVAPASGESNSDTYDGRYKGKSGSSVNAVWTAPVDHSNERAKQTPQWSHRLHTMRSVRIKDPNLQVSMNLFCRKSISYSCISISLSPMTTCILMMHLFPLVSVSPLFFLKINVFDPWTWFKTMLWYLLGISFIQCRNPQSERGSSISWLNVPPLLVIMITM